MVELRDEEDGRVALIMDKEEVPFAVEAFMRSGYGLTPPNGAEAEESGEPEAQAEEPQAQAEEEPEEEPGEEPGEEPEDPQAEAEEPEDPEAEEEPRGRGRRIRRTRSS